MTSEKPLVTFGLISYKQERFIEEAARSALAQDYSPLEIVISDDCSPDNTFSIIEKIVSEYAGPHKIILNRNLNNLGLAGNINRMWELSSGEFLVIQAGDDVSVPHRTSRLVDAWLSNRPQPSIVFSNELFIDELGNPLFENNSIKSNKPLQDARETLTGKQTFVIGGCAAGYDRKTHYDVGPLNPNVIAEDFVYSFRALLANGYCKVDEPLVHYRQNNESIIGKFKDSRIPYERIQYGDLARLTEYKKALEYYNNVNPYWRWRLNRRISLVRRRIKAKRGEINKVSFIFWLVVTGRYKSIKKELAALI